MDDQDMDDKPEFSAGSPDFAPRSQLAPWHEDPRAMFRTVAGLAGIPGLSQAGMGMLGGAARAVDPAERMMRGGMLASRMGQAGGVNPNLLKILGYGTPAAGAAYGGYKLFDAARNLLNRGQPEPEKRSEAPGMLQMAGASDWMKPKPRPTGAGDRRDKRIRDAEDADVKTG